MGWLARLGFDRRSAAAKARVADVRMAPSRAGTKIWAIGGGKGGVGKSLIASTMGVLLSEYGKKVLLVDADFGAANLHTLIEGNENGLSLSNFLLTGARWDLSCVISGTAIPNLEFISGGRDSLDVADFSDDRLSKLWKALRRVEHDYVLLDVGPGTSSSNLDIFLGVDEGILVTTPDPTSIENMYRFLKCLYSRQMKKIMGSGENIRLREAIQEVVRSNGNPGLMSLADILSNLDRIDAALGSELRDLLGSDKISLIVNQAKSSEDSELGASIARACHSYFGFNVRRLGCVFYDDVVVGAIRSRKTLALHYKRSKTVRTIGRCVDRLLEKEEEGY